MCQLKHVLYQRIISISAWASELLILTIVGKFEGPEREISNWHGSHVFGIWMWYFFI